MGDRSVLLTGASGLLGHWMLRAAPDPNALVALTSRRRVLGIPDVRADLRDRGSTMAAVRRANPSLVIHAAYAKDRASIVDATQHLIDACASAGAGVMFISSDAVFAGDGIARDEAAVPDPVWDYGRWKAEAERIVRRASDHAGVVRLPLLVSVAPDDHVVGKLRTSAGRNETTQWFADETRRPAMASEVATALWRIASLPPEVRSGVWHLAGACRLSRYEIAQRVADHLGLSHDLVEGVKAPDGADRPRDLDFTDERARAAIEWHPSPILR